MLNRQWLMQGTTKHAWWLKGKGGKTEKERKGEGGKKKKALRGPGLKSSRLRTKYQRAKGPGRRQGNREERKREVIRR